MNRLIKITSILILLLIFFSKYCLATEKPEINSEGAILIEQKSGTILYEKNADQKLYPASTTKILTAIIAIEKCGLNEIATASKEAIYVVPSGYTIANIQVGESFTIEELLKVMLVHSANEAANIIAEHVSGSMEEFAKLMNEKAVEIGCKNSNFVNSNGIQNENHYSTAHDMALIAKYCMENEKFREIISLKKCELPKTQIYTEQRIFKNNNSLIDEKDKYYYEYCIGGKTGYTKEAKNCLVAMSKKDNMELITVVLKAENGETGESTRNPDTIALFKYGYDNYNMVTLKKKGEEISSVDIKNSEGETKTINVALSEDISTINTNKNEKINLESEPEIKLEVDSAPIQKGEVVGTVTYKINGEKYTSNIMATETIEESIENLENNTNKTILEIIVVTIILIITIIFIIRKISKRRTPPIIYIDRGYRKVPKRRRLYSGKGKHSV